MQMYGNCHCAIHKLDCLFELGIQTNTDTHNGRCLVMDTFDTIRLSGLWANCYLVHQSQIVTGVVLGEQTGIGLRVLNCSGLWIEMIGAGGNTYNQMLAHLLC